jgi:Outer membrane protein beta-barrel domain
MKKTITTLAVSMLYLSATVFSQTLPGQSGASGNTKKPAKTYLDLMINVVSTNFNYGDANSSLADYKKSGNGIQAGASFQAGITHRFSLVAELYFIRKGGKLKTGNPLTVSESNLRFNTIEWPLLARFHCGRFYMNAGPSIAYNLSGTRKIETVSSKLVFTDASEGFKRFDAGVQAGAGVEFPFKQRRIALDIRYHYGITNIAYTREIYNRAIMISVHFSKAWKTNPLAVQ